MEQGGDSERPQGIRTYWRAHQSSLLTPTWVMECLFQDALFYLSIGHVSCDILGVSKHLLRMLQAQPDIGHTRAPLVAKPRNTRREPQCASSHPLTDPHRPAPPPAKQWTSQGRGTHGILLASRSCSASALHNPSFLRLLLSSFFLVQPSNWARRKENQKAEWWLVDLSGTHDRVSSFKNYKKNPTPG